MPSPFPPASARIVGLAAAGLFGLVAVSGSVYGVQPTEMAEVRRFGVVTTPAPIGPGLHAKARFIDSVDHIQVSLTTFRASDLGVYTIDNQPVRIGIGLGYRMPTDAVFKRPYGVGRTGNVDIDGMLRFIVADRALRVFARRITVGIVAEREAIATELRRSIQEAVLHAFGIEIVDLQLRRIEYSPSFTASVEAAVTAKNDALQPENTVQRVRYEGEQAKVLAEAQASAVATRAEREARQAVARARADRKATVLRPGGGAGGHTARPGAGGSRRRGKRRGRGQPCHRSRRNRAPLERCLACNHAGCWHDPHADAAQRAAFLHPTPAPLETLA